MKRRRFHRGFTLIEVLIVVVILAVLATIVISQFGASTRDAKESTLKFNLHTMHAQIGVYRLQHLGTFPDVLGEAASGYLPQLTNRTNAMGKTGTDPLDYPFGPYFDEVPTNPFNGDNSVVRGTGTAGDGSSGWQYDPATGEIWPNHAGWWPDEIIPKGEPMPLSYWSLYCK